MTIKKTKKETKVSEINLDKNKRKKTKLEKEALKNAVFEDISFGMTIDDIATKYGYTKQHISGLSIEIDEEFMLQVQSDREKKIRKQIQRIEGISKGLYRDLQSCDNPRDRVMIHKQIITTMEYQAKLQGLLVNAIEVNDKTDKTDAFLTMFGVFDNKDIDGNK